MTHTVQHPVGQMKAGDHGCLSFGSEAEQREVLTSYVHTGLERHEQVICFAPGDPASLLDLLRDSGFEPDPFTARGQLQVIAPQQGFLAYRPFDPDIMVDQLRRAVGRACDAGYEALRIAGEPSVLRDQPGADKLGEYEQNNAAIFAEAPVVGLCQYDRRVFTQAEIEEAESWHAHHTVGPNPLYEDAGLSIFRTFEPPGFRMVGELDIAQVVAWLNWISRAVGGTETDLYLNLAGLRFIDVAGARMLALLSDNLARHGRALVLHGLEPAHCIVFHLAGWDQLPNLVLSEAQA